MRNFYEQWLKVLDLPTSKVKNPVTAFDYATDYSPAVQTSLKASFDAQVDAALWGTGDSVKAQLTGTDAYVDGNVAKIFGVTGVTGTTLQKVTVNPQQRAGILTHPVIMSTFATETSSHPIKRGVFFWDKFLCQPLPSPPNNVPPFVPPAAGQSLRQDFETMTADPVACQPCHMRINPVGFLFEHYDSMGYYRDDRQQQPAGQLGDDDRRHERPDAGRRDDGRGPVREPPGHGRRLVRVVHGEPGLPLRPAPARGDR